MKKKKEGEGCERKKEGRKRRDKKTEGKYGRRKRRRHLTSCIHSYLLTYYLNTGCTGGGNNNEQNALRRRVSGVSSGGMERSRRLVDGSST